jgi:hypothetical protein
MSFFQVNVFKVIKITVSGWIVFELNSSFVFFLSLLFLFDTQRFYISRNRTKSLNLNPLPLNSLVYISSKTNLSFNLLTQSFFFFLRLKSRHNISLLNHSLMFLLSFFNILPNLILPIVLNLIQFLCLFLLLILGLLLGVFLWLLSVARIKRNSVLSEIILYMSNKWLGDLLDSLNKSVRFVNKSHFK